VYETPVKVNVELSVIQIDTILSILEEMRDIKETLAQCALVSGENELYDKAQRQIGITQTMHKIFDDRKSKYWNEGM